MIEERFEVSDRPRLVVRIARGSVRLREGEPGSIHVVADGATDRLTVSAYGDTVSIEEERGRFLSGSTDVTVRVPATTSVEVNVASAVVEVDGPVAELRVQAASGDVRAVDVRARAHVRTASGDITIDTVAGDVEVATASGDIELGTVEGRCDCRTASGQIRVGTTRDEVELRTVSGDTRIGRCEGASVRLKSVSGDLDLALPPGRRVSYDVQTLSGDVRVPEGRGGEQPESRDPVAVRLEARSVSGDLTVRGLPE